MELKSEQQAFLAECEHDFAARYTLEDEEFKTIFDSEIPSPPVMSNWYPRHKRNQGGRGGRYKDFADRRHDNRYNNRPDYGRSYDRSERSSHYDNYRDSGDHNQGRNDYRSRDSNDYYGDKSSSATATSSQNIAADSRAIAMGYMETINYVLYDNPVSQGCINVSKEILKPIVKFANGSEPPQIQIIRQSEPLWTMAKEHGPYVRIAGLSGALAVSLAAYGAHKKYPKDRINELKAVADSANKMHFFHSLALLGVPLCRNPRATGGLFIAGTILFSGPCYYYAFTGENKFGKLAPIGGTILILGWLSMVL